MADLDHIIEFESEHTGLDFKLEEYVKPKKADLIKDVMAMANASIPGDRLIIIGMKPAAGDRGIVGVNSVSDPASIQQVIIDNVEPEIHLDYMAYMYEGKQLAVIRIYDCQNRPYLMKKDFQSEKVVLRRGEGFVRLGTTQTRIYRSIFEQIYKERYDRERFAGKCQVSFEKNQWVEEWLIHPAPITGDDFPSSIQGKKIEKVIAKKEIELSQFKRMGMPFDESFLSMASMTIASSANLTGRSVDYEHRSLAILRLDLEGVRSTYYEDDYYFLLEKNAEKLTLFIKNTGAVNLQAIRIVLRVPKMEGLLVAKKQPKDPDQRGPNVSLHYPQVEDHEAYYEVSRDLGDLQPQLTINVFEEPLRLCVMPKFESDHILLPMTFYAKNLPAPIEKELRLLVRPNEQVPAETPTI